MSHKILRPFIIKVSVLGYFPLHKLRSTQSTNSFKSLLKTYLFTTAFPWSLLLSLFIILFTIFFKYCYRDGIKYRRRTSLFN